MEPVRSTSFPLGGIVLIDKIEKHYGLFSRLFSGIGGKAEDFIEIVKFLAYNKLTYGVSVHQIPEQYPEEAFSQLGIRKVPLEKSFYRALERIGGNYAIIHERFQDMFKENKLVSKDQMVDWSSTYFEGGKAAMGELGYSRDHRPGKKQITFGISVGANNLPSALTIQKGNVPDKTHMKSMMKVLPRILDKDSVLIFDCGANTKTNKKKIRKLGFHYLTLMAKKKKTYAKYIRIFHEGEKEGNCVSMEIGGNSYKCVKYAAGGEIKYIFYSDSLKESQLKNKEKKFRKALEKNDKTLVKVKKGKTLSALPSSGGWINLRGHLQKTVDSIPNTYITGIEGFFTLESSLDDEPEKILLLYKDRDKAEKFIRDLKEGLDVHPVRHWTKLAILGHLLVCFLAETLINLTLSLAPKPEVRNALLLKKHLTSLTLTVVYPKNRFRFTILSNVSAQIRGILGDFVEKYHDKLPDLRW